VSGRWGPQPWDDPTPNMSYTAPAFHPETVAHRTPVSRQLLDDPRYEQYRADLIREAVDHAVLSIEREVYSATLPAGRASHMVEVTVPYSVTVSVDLPRRWWERLLHLPARTVDRSAGGTVHGVAWVDVDVEATFRYPQFYGAGPAVPTGAFTTTPGPVRVESVDTHPLYGVQAAESRTLLRCPARGGGGCGHYLSSHLRPDDGYEPGGCTITGCRCLRYFDGPWT
jgi:hypothetical protein